MKYEAKFDHDTGLCQVKDISTGDILNEFKTVYTFYNTQYPPPISDDGKYIVFGDWEKATYCYSVNNGELIWKKGPGKVCDIFFSPDNKSVFAYMCDRGIYQRNMADGEIIQTVKMSGMEEFFFDETRKWLFAGPKHLYYFIFEIPTLNTLYKIPKRTLDVNRCLSFGISSVSLFSNESIMITGGEEYPDMKYIEGTAQSFARTIDISPFKI